MLEKLKVKLETLQQDRERHLDVVAETKLELKSRDSLIGILQSDLSQTLRDSESLQSELRNRTQTLEQCQGQLLEARDEVSRLQIELREKEQLVAYFQEVFSRESLRRWQGDYPEVTGEYQDFEEACVSAV